ncbi:MAG: diaminopimelate decarboxylase [Oscillospiraceae bacterium]|nr:diaminopimelate decarboxylase [Oscillospiraceae bacterium]
MISSNITRNNAGVVCFAGHSVAALAEEYGTPLYLMDEERLRSNCRMYLNAFATHFGPGSRVLYAAKACSFKEIFRIAAEEGMGLDTVSIGEAYTALAAGFPAERIYFHGDAKTDKDIRFALEHGLGCVVADNPDELALLNAEAKRLGIRQKVLLRITPGIDPHTYEAVNTGTVDVKFGVPIETGQAEAFVRAAMAMEHLDAAGLHCHVGSEVFDEDVFQRTCDVMVDFMARVHGSLGFTARELDLGGGYGVRYVDSDPAADIPARIGEVAAHLRALVDRAGLPMPYVLMEPGRSIVADAGMTVYTVSTVKRIPRCKNYVIVDGGMADNPRWCLYRARYTVLHGLRQDGETDVFDLAGRCCESGDVIQPAVTLPADVCRGDLVCVCTTGAYNYSMASNYNRLGRPPVVMLSGDGARLAVRRETPEDLIALDL